MPLAKTRPTRALTIKAVYQACTHSEPVKSCIRPTH